MKTKTYKVETIDGLEVVNLDQEVEQDSKHRKGLPWVTIASVALGLTFVIGGTGAIAHAGNGDEQLLKWAKGYDEEDETIGGRKLAVMTDIKAYDITVKDLALKDSAMKATLDADGNPTDYAYTKGGEAVFTNKLSVDGSDRKDFSYTYADDIALIDPVVDTDYKVDVKEVFNDSDHILYAAVLLDDGNVVIQEGKTDSEGVAEFMENKDTDGNYLGTGSVSITDLGVELVEGTGTTIDPNTNKPVVTYDGQGATIFIYTDREMLVKALADAKSNSGSSPITGYTRFVNTYSEGDVVKLFKNPNGILIVYPTMNTGDDSMVFVEDVTYLGTDVIDGVGHWFYKNASGQKYDMLGY